MRIVTFYSYKGGVGRTLACANFGLYLAKMGQKVVLVDMDFEAPGLDSKFSAISPKDFEGGILDQFVAFQTGRPVPGLPKVPVVLPEDVTRSGGSLHLIPAGDYTDPSYYSTLSKVKWEQFSSTEPGIRFCLELTQKIERAFGADVLIIDSRTGLTETGGLCTQVFPDTVLLFTCTSRESLAGIQRVYSRIKNSPIVMRRHHGRNQLDVRIIVTRIPHPPDLPAFDRSMRERIELPEDRLYYLFEEDNLSLDEYLAVDRFGDSSPTILDDYVELFASLHPEVTLPYVAGRLEAFRAGITRRSPAESERLIQELLTLFPVPDVFLEAAHYYRIVRDGDAKAVMNYVRYLDVRQDDAAVLREFAELCGTAPLSVLKPPDRVIRILRSLDPTRMSPEVLNRFLDVADSERDYRSVVGAIESDADRLESDDYRQAYLRALYALREWTKIVQASKGHVVPRSLWLFVAEAYANLGDVPGVRKILERLERLDPDDTMRVFRIISRIMPDASADSVLHEFPMLDSEMLRFGVHMRPFRGEHDSAFRNWVRRLEHELSERGPRNG
jgi:cellulose biosynthesis protein BcsQ